MAGSAAGGGYANGYGMGAGSNNGNLPLGSAPQSLMLRGTGQMGMRRGPLSGGLTDQDMGSPFYNSANGVRPPFVSAPIQLPQQQQSGWGVNGMPVQSPSIMGGGFVGGYGDNGRFPFIAL